MGRERPDKTGIPFGGYRLVTRIARGGMAEVFLARQRGPEGFDRVVALKRILPHLVDSEDFVNMFLQEAKLAARLSHANIVHIYDFGKVDEQYFIAMEHVDGCHAGALIRRASAHPVPPELVARIGADACAGLHHAHALRGSDGRALRIVHRDISPPNLLVSKDGMVKLVDFGIAKAATAVDATRPGVVKGKFAYVSPEQAGGESLDGRSDVFSLGLVLYELLAGEPAVDRKEPMESMRRIRRGELPRVKDARPEVPPALAEAVESALEVHVENRPTALELGTALEAFIKQSPELGTSLQLAAWIEEHGPPRTPIGDLVATSGGSSTAARAADEGTRGGESSATPPEPQVDSPPPKDARAECGQADGTCGGESSAPPPEPAVASPRPEGARAYRGDSRANQSDVARDTEPGEADRIDRPAPGEADRIDHPEPDEVGATARPERDETTGVDPAPDPDSAAEPTASEPAAVEPGVSEGLGGGDEVAARFREGETWSGPFATFRPPPAAPSASEAESAGKNGSGARAPEARSPEARAPEAHAPEARARETDAHFESPHFAPDDEQTREVTPLAGPPATLRAPEASLGDPGGAELGARAPEGAKGGRLPVALALVGVALAGAAAAAGVALYLDGARQGPGPASADRASGAAERPAADAARARAREGAGFRENGEPEPGAGRGAIDAGPAPAQLEVRTDPEGAAIRLEDEDAISRAPATFEALEPGEHAIAIEKGDHEPLERALELEPGERRSLEVALTPREERDRGEEDDRGEQDRERARAEERARTSSAEPDPAPAPEPEPAGERARERPAPSEPEEPAEPEPGRLIIRTHPYSVVYAGDRRLGTTPFADVELPPGTYTLTFRNPDHPPHERRVTIEAGSEKRLNFELP